MKPITIAIDGYSSCGKSTIAKSLAAKLHYSYVDTGAMYRAVTLYCIDHGLIKDHAFDEHEIVLALKDIHLTFKFNPNTKSSETFLNGINVEKEIRSMNVSSSVSPVSKIHEVRVHLVALQREMGKNKAVVMDGRDIGTNVFPDAELKIFMTADPDIRTHRRYDELAAKGVKITFEEVRENLISRDHEDTHRKENPLIKADDAIVLDNTDLTREEQLEFVVKLVEDLSLGYDLAK
ncbi:MAG: (d)CMP kinase [Bacteroidetes bacterium]|jgi:cytidylate kinase|nr:(d)CMP kinase [Bacteroidota bacterium]